MVMRNHKGLKPAFVQKRGRGEGGGGVAGVAECAAPYRNPHEARLRAQVQALQACRHACVQRLSREQAQAVLPQRAAPAQGSEFNVLHVNESNNVVNERME